MLLTEQKLRKVIRQTIRQNNYRIDERFYTELNRNLVNEGAIETMSKAFNVVKDKFLSSKRKKDTKGMKKPARIFSQLCVPLAMIALFNSVSDGKIAEKGIDRIHAAAVDAQREIVIDSLETGSVDDMSDAEDILKQVENKSMSLQDMKNLISMVKNLNSCKKLGKEIADLETQLEKLNNKTQESQEDLDDFIEAICNIFEKGNFTPTINHINDQIITVMTNNL